MSANSRRSARFSERFSGRRLTRRFTQLFVGLFLYGVGIAFLVRSALGAAPWDVLSQGISLNVPFSFGVITIFVSAVVLMLWIPLRQKPGIGTIANALLIGPSADLTFLVLPAVHTLWVQLIFVFIGIIVVGLATGMYIGARFGPGPRDGLTTGLHRVTKWPIWVVRTLIEVTVVALGWSLGGVVGLGTVAFALLIGPACQLFMPKLYVVLPEDSTDV